jgi:putative nucleotidyltransferase with HDIG domain
MQDVSAQRVAEIQIDQQIKRLTALSEIDRAIISGLDQQHTLGVILSATLSQLQVDAADILLLDPDGQLLNYAAGQGFQTRAMEEIHVRFGESPAGRVARERRLIRIPSLPEQTNDPLFNVLVLKENFVSYVGVPLIVKKEVKGVLEVFHRTLFQPYQEWLDFLYALAGQTAIAIENATLLGNLKTSNQELAQAYDATLEGWSHAMDLRDKETEGHTRRVTELTVKVARAMGINESQLLHIRRGALLHDIGKLGIPDHILFKPGKLTQEEWEIMQKHPEYAYEMLSSIQYLKPALPIPYFHHEKWDGSGYPLGLRGEQIPLEARIFSVIDVWDALLSDRPYRKAWTVERTLEHIRTLAGSHFDPVVVDCFMKIMKP